MRLSFNQIAEIVTGAARIEEENGAVRLYRFTEEQEELYKETNLDFYKKTFSTAGIKLHFKTDCRKMSLKAAVMPGSSRTYFSVDVCVDGKLIGCLDNFSGTALPRDYTKLELPLGLFYKEFLLGDGIKDVCVHMPWSVSTAVEYIELEGGSFIEGLKRQKKLLAFGDSITQGYDALRPSCRYTARLAEALCADEYNKAIGGERFFPSLAGLKESFIPDYITVAYGTNDWNCTDEETFKEKCQAFYEALNCNYPTSKIFAITPIWRKDMNEERVFGNFANVEADTRDAVRGMKNITVISGFDFVPQNEEYFADLRLHPDDIGFEYYFRSLYDKIKSLT